MSAIELDYAIPSPDVAEHVTLFYRFACSEPVFGDTERADHAQFRFRLSPGGTIYTMGDGSRLAASDAHIVGAKTGSMAVEVAGPVLGFGFGITPAGWSAMIGVDASTMMNRVVDARDLFGADLVDRHLAALTAADGLPEMAAIGEALVRALASRRGHLVSSFIRQVDAWLAGSASPDLDLLVAATGLSRRQVERKCKALYGAPPKLLARKYRALRAATGLVAGSVSLDEVVAHGFYDQSHLIREVKQFTGLTPRQISANPSALAMLTVMQRRALTGQVNPLISDT